MINFKDLLDKKRKEPQLDEKNKASKMAMLEEIKERMKDMMANHLENNKMKKVEVAGSSPEALTMGLDKAKMMIDPEEEEEEKLGAEPKMDFDPMAEDVEHQDEVMEPEEEIESADDELTDDEIQKLEMLLLKLKRSKMK